MPTIILLIVLLYCYATSSGACAQQLCMCAPLIFCREVPFFLHRKFIELGFLSSQFSLLVINVLSVVTRTGASSWDSERANEGFDVGGRLSGDLV